MKKQDQCPGAMTKHGVQYSGHLLSHQPPTWPNMLGFPMGVKHAGKQLRSEFEPKTLHFFTDMGFVNNGQCIRWLLAMLCGTLCMKKVWRDIVSTYFHASAQHNQTNMVSYYMKGKLKGHSEQMSLNLLADVCLTIATTLCDAYLRLTTKVTLSLKLVGSWTEL